MSDVKKIATRESYGNALAELGAEHKDVVVLDADLAAATKTGVFKKAFSGALHRLWYRREQYDGSSGRTCNDRSCTVCKFLRNVCGRTCI